MAQTRAMDRSGRNAVIALALAGVSIFFAGCAGTGVGSSGPTAPVVSASASVPPAPVDFECGGYEIDAASYAAGLHADALPDSIATGLARALDDAGAPAALDDPKSWIVVGSTPTRTAVIRALSERVDAPWPNGSVDHEYRVFELLSPHPATQGPAWMPMGGADCALRFDPSPLMPADVYLDPTALPSAADTVIHLLVLERGCNSGNDATDRVELFGASETPDRVEVEIAVQAKDGFFTCPTHPPTRFVIELDAPLGDRVLYDGNMVSPQPLVPWS